MAKKSGKKEIKMKLIETFSIFLIILGLIGCSSKKENQQEKFNLPVIAEKIQSPANPKNPKPTADSKRGNQVPETEAFTLPLPKLKLTEEWLKQLQKYNLPNASRGQLISILGILEGKTFIADSNYVVHEIETSLSADYSQYLNTFSGADKKQIDEFFAKNPETVSIPTENPQTIHVFSSYTGPINVSTKNSPNIRKEGFTFLNSSDWNFTSLWEKNDLSLDSSGNTLATYSIPCILRQFSSLVDKKELPKFYLAGVDGRKYYAPDEEINAALLSKQLLNCRELQFKMKIKAPADDFTLNLFIEDRVWNPPASLIIGFDPLDENNLESKDIRELEELNERYLKYLPFNSSKRGHNRILGKISAIQLLLGKYPEALAIINRLTKEIPGKDIEEETANFVYLQKIVALVKLRALKAAILELNKADDKKIPRDYQHYLIKNMLLQLEKQESSAFALANPQNSPLKEKLELLKEISWNEFLSQVVITPLVTEDLHRKIRTPLTAQEMWDTAYRLYIRKQYPQAQSILHAILASKPDDMVVIADRDGKFKAGLEALDMLVNIYRNENNNPEALKYAQRMIDKYCYDQFYTIADGVPIYSGPGGAIGLNYQIDILTNNSERDGGVDYATVFKLAHTLIKKFDGVLMPCYEYCASYEDFVGDFIKNYLERKNATLTEWKKEIKEIVSETKNKPLQANLLLFLGQKCMALGDTPYAIQMYNEVFENYNETYVIPMDGFCFLQIFFIDAFEELAKIYKDKPEVEQLRIKLKTKCKVIRAIMLKDEAYDKSCTEGKYVQYIKNCTKK